jgi:sarcosine oxidase
VRPSHHTAVIGLGGVGSAALFWSAKRDDPSGVIGFEREVLGHDHGASDDHSRIIRRAQHQEPYATLVDDAYRTWAEVESESGQQLIVRTGGLIIEAVDERRELDTGTRNIDGYAHLLRQHGVPFELLSPTEVSKRWPQFRFDGTERAIYQADSGLVDARRATATHLALALSAGAEVQTRTPVRALRPAAAGIEVVTDTQVTMAERVIVAADARTNELLPEGQAKLPLRVTQEQVTYYVTPWLTEFSPQAFPVFMWHGRANFYGFPVYGEMATKLGQHLGGNTVTADTRTFEPDPVRIARQRAFLEKHIPRFAGPELYTKTCLYTLPPDQDFVLDLLPDDKRIAVFIGAGHAFKFASLIGKILTGLVADGKTGYPLAAFRIDRPGLTDAGFVPSYHV